MPCEAGSIGTNVPGLFKAKAGNLLLNWGISKLAYIY